MHSGKSEFILETQLAYWTQQLANIPLLQLPTDRPRPAVSSFQGARLHLQLPQSLAAELRGNVSNIPTTTFTC